MRQQIAQCPKLPSKATPVSYEGAFDQSNIIRQHENNAVPYAFLFNW